MGASVLILALTGCTGGLEQALVAASPACERAGELFDRNSSADRSSRLGELATMVPTELAPTVEQLAGSSPETVSGVDLERLQEWAIDSCGTEVAAPATTEPGTPQTFVAAEGGHSRVTVTGATTLDEALRFCEEAAARHASAAPEMRVLVFDDVGILLADDSSGECSIVGAFEAKPEG